MKINQKSAATLAAVCGLSLMALTSEQALASENKAISPAENVIA